MTDFSARARSVLRVRWPVYFVTFVGVTAFCAGASNGSRSAIAPPPSGSAPDPIRTAVDPVVALPPDPEFDRAVAIKNEAIAKCDFGGGIVAMGFGTHVICLKPQCVEWTRDPHFPPFKTGLAK
jgi:hypothetical protein